jgi:hypothetical protein
MNIQKDTLTSPLLPKSEIKEVKLDIKETKQSEPLIYYGPRKKNLATRHLEYIIKSFIDNPEQVSVRFEQKDCIVQVDKLTFSLSDILRAHVNFEQIIFTIEQLNKCLKFFNFGPRPPKTSNLNLSEYHPAESRAIELWETKTDKQINEFLTLEASKDSLLDGFGRQDYYDNECLPVIFSALGCKTPDPFLKKDVNKVMFILLNICLTAHALSRPYNEPEMSLNLYRCDRGLETDTFLQERKKAATDQELIFSKRFTSTSTNKDYVDYFGNIMTYYHQSPSFNPSAKDISHLMGYMNAEAEVLIPPGIDFLYVENTSKKRWELKLFRAINHEKNDSYHPDISEKDSKIISDRLMDYDGEDQKFMQAVNLGRRRFAVKKAVIFTLILLSLVFLGSESLLSILDRSLTGLFDKFGRNEKEHTQSCAMLAGIFLVAATLLIPPAKGYIKESRKTKLSFFASDDKHEFPSRYSWPCSRL